jgi:hypothetical protein
VARAKVIAALALAIALGGCAHGGGGVSISARAWWEVSSPHFRARGDVSAGRLREIVIDVEQTYAALADLTGFSFSSQVDLVVLGERADFDAVFPGEFAGAFVSRQNDDLRPAMVVLDSGRGWHALLQHELTHRFVAGYLSSAPPWLNEGLAEYYSTFELRDGKTRAS